MADDTSRARLRPGSIPIYGAQIESTAASVAPPIYQTSTFAFDNLAAFDAAASDPTHDEFYSRYGNPTTSLAASLIARLEGTEDCTIFSSGMGALTTAAMAFLKSGDHVIAQEATYTGTTGLIREILEKFNVETTFVDQTDSAAFERAIRPNTRMMFLETPSNPLLQLTDLAAVAAIARRHDVLTLCDNTFATPLGQNPAAHGVDLILHSATKALGGHSDLLAGAVAGPHHLTHKLRHTASIIGATLGPFEGWLLVRGLRTLRLRVDQHSRNAMAVAEFLSAHEKVRRVHYPGLASHPQHALAISQMRSFGCVVSFQLDVDDRAMQRFISSLKLLRFAVSLGSYDSLIARIGSAFALHPPGGKRQDVPRSLLRLSVGIEDPDDICDDLARALAAL